MFKEQSNIKFDIYRKETHTNNYIHSTSPTFHKYLITTFNSLFFRLFHIPLSKENFNKELNHIFYIGKINGYTIDFISKIYKRIKENYFF